MGSRHSEADWRNMTGEQIRALPSPAQKRAQARKRLASSRASRNGASAEAEFDAAAAKWPDTCLATCGPRYQRTANGIQPRGTQPHVDRVGVIAGVPVCIEIKSTAKVYWDATLAAFPAHERAFAASFAASGGLSLLLVRLGPFPHAWRFAVVSATGMIGAYREAKIAEPYHPLKFTSLPTAIAYIKSNGALEGADSCKVSP